jgi:hypothetical protein
MQHAAVDSVWARVGMCMREWGAVLGASRVDVGRGSCDRCARCACAVTQDASHTPRTEPDVGGAAAGATAAAARGGERAGAPGGASKGKGGAHGA